MPVGEALAVLAAAFVELVVVESVDAVVVVVEASGLFAATFAVAEEFLADTPVAAVLGPRRLSP